MQGLFHNQFSFNVGLSTGGGHIINQLLPVVPLLVLCQGVVVSPGTYVLGQHMLTHDKLPVLECHIIDLDLLPVLPKPGGQDDAVCPLDKQLDLPLQIESFKMDPLPVARKPITMISRHWSHLMI